MHPVDLHLVQELLQLTFSSLDQHATRVMTKTNSNDHYQDSSSSFQDSETEIKPEANVSTRTWLARLLQLKDKAKIV